jgi:hypothetical protein
MQKRTLTVRFARAITSASPNTMEVSVIPLATTSDVVSNTTFVGGPQVRILVLASDTNTLTFDLVPTDDPDLTAPIHYRIAWRERYLGKQYTADFVMPDEDVEFADLDDMGNIISAI